MIKNITRKTIIAENFRECKTAFSKAIGLMLSKPKPLVFVFPDEKIVPLHMFFVFYPIDVLFLNKEKKVVEMKENFRPFTFYTPNKKARYIIELPKKTIRKSKTEVGDLIGF